MTSDVENIRSDFLVHWTGKDIEEEYRDPRSKNNNNDQFRHGEYVNRMNSMLTDGMWMNDQVIELNSTYSGGNLGMLNWPATCFTEIRLSRTLSHAKRYGFFGLGFNRQFALERFGAPVLYVPGPQESGLNALDNIGPHFHRLLGLSSFLEKQTLDMQQMAFPHATVSVRNFPEFTKFIDASGLQIFLEDLNIDKSKKPDAYHLFYLLRSSTMTCAIFVKRMSDDDCTRPFELLDEAEWRIPYTDHMVIKDIIKQTNQTRPRGKIPFTEKELKLIIFPDDETRGMAYKMADRDLVLAKYLHAPHLITPTVEECMHF
jgi:hypothetical protein